MLKSSEFRLARCMAWLAGAAVVLIGGGAHAQTTYAVSLNANSLEPSLLALASQTKQQIIFPHGLVVGRHAPAVKGQLTPEEALGRLLAGTDLRARRVNAAVVIVERPIVSGQGPAVGAEAAEGRPFATAELDPSDPEAPIVTSASDGPGAGEATTVEEVRVTGSNLRGVAPAAPLRVLTRDALERTGQTTLTDALRALPENFGGGAAEGAVASGSDRIGRNGSYGTALNLRGLGNNATLVLINGKRVSGSGQFGDYVDISTIPSAAVERVEVLLDGASAIYGADAVGGVVNIIMKRPYDGAETRVLAGIGTSGEPAQGAIAQTFGRTWTGGGVLLSYELSRRDALAGSDRRFAADADLRPLGGTDQRLANAFPGNILLPDPVTRALVPAYAIPGGQNGVGLRAGDLQAGVVNRTNQRQGTDILPRQTLNAVYLSAEQALGSRLELNADARYSARRYKSHGAPIATNLTVTSANPFYVSPIGAASESVAYSFAEEADNPTAYGVTETLGGSASATLKLKGDWRAQAFGAYAQETAEIRNGGALNSAFLSEALGAVPDRPETSYRATRDGVFNPFSGLVGANSPGVIGFVTSGYTLNRARSDVTSAGAQADGSLWTLPAGAMKLALGAQARRERLRRQGSNWFSTVTPVAQVPTDQDRTVLAAFAEARVPLFGGTFTRPGVERLELILAGRIEHYESFGATANPKVGAVWTPREGLDLRLSYGRSFRAPALREAFDTQLYSPANLTVGTGRIQGLSLGGGNPDLKPETADSWALGFDWRPPQWPGLTFSVSAYDVRFKNRIDRPVAANIANALTDPTLAPFVTRISPATNAADRALLLSYLESGFLNTGGGTFPPEAYGAIIDNRYVNTAALKVRGVDASGSFAFELGGDQVVVGGSASYIADYDQQVTPGSAAFDRVGVINFPVRFRGRMTADWTRGPLTLGGAVNHQSGYHDTLGAGIRGQTTFDLQARLTPADHGPLEGVAVLLNLRNVFDRAPPFYNNTVGVGYDGANADVVGRFVSLQLTRRW
jgi:iron complex outermembrane receptor protein